MNLKLKSLMQLSKAMLLAPFVFLAILFGFKKTESVELSAVPKSFYDLSILSLDEKDTIKMSDYKGKKILIVNVASECGYTYQYKDLQKLYEKYMQKMVIIGFPCNQFGFQEPGDKEEIEDFCEENYGVSFPMTTKIDVKGSNQDPIYTWLTRKSFNEVDDYSVKWNFNKFLIDSTGKLIGYFGTKTEPFDEELIKKIES
jgi:glutathione peroxidase